jgi:hypothetical protein
VVRDLIEGSGALHEARLVRHAAMDTARDVAREGLPEPLAVYLCALVDLLDTTGRA